MLDETRAARGAFDFHWGFLDLSRPPVDADGWPTRIDGFDVGVRMLARAMGLGASIPGGACFAGYAPGGWFLSGDEWAFFHASAETEGIAKAIIVPALADIDTTDPDADRLALVAVIRSKPWRK